MSASEIVVQDGPGKEELLRVAADTHNRLHVTFHTPGEPLEAHIDGIDEEGLDGLHFALHGRLKSPNFSGAYFAGVYDAGTRTGRLRLQGSM
jgi:hypothetical protein